MAAGRLQRAFLARRRFDTLVRSTIRASGQVLAGKDFASPSMAKRAGATAIAEKTNASTRS
jgi:hypothetical protein